MTVSSENRRAGPFSGDDISTTFPFTFKVFASSDIVVTNADSIGVETVLVLDSDYTVSLNADQDSEPGGDVVLSVPLVTGSAIAITSAVPATQESVIPSMGSFSPSVLNRLHDKLTILVQQVSELASRSVKIPVTSSDDPDALIESVISSAESASLSASAAADSAAGALHGYDVRWFGGVSGGSPSANATAFSSAVAAAVSGGVKRVYIPFDSWTVTTGTDAQGCTVVGNGTTALTGVIGAKSYPGCVISGVQQDYVAVHPTIPADSSMKLVKVVDANTLRILVQKPTTGYAYLTLKNNSTTNGSDSLGVTFTDATQWRVTSIQDAVEAVCGYLDGGVKSATVSSAVKSGGNTGTGTLTLDANTPVLAGRQAGVYQVRCTATAVNGGTFSVTSPSSEALGTVAVGSTFSSQIKFTIADGGSDFVVGDGFDITVVDNHWIGTSLVTDIPSYTSGTDYKYTRSTTIGAWIEFTVTVPLDGFLSVTLIESSSASTDVTISIDGVPIDSNFSCYAATARRVERRYLAKPGSRVVRIQNNTAGSTGLNVVGVYFARLKDQRDDVPIDTYGVYRNSANIDPLTQSSANDYVIKDYSSTVNGVAGIYGGSYHGGESAISTAMYINGSPVTITSGAIAIGRSVEFQQSCTITWAGAKSGCVYSGASVTVHTRMTVITGGYALMTTITGDITAKELYTTLFGVNESYDAVIFPQYKLLSSVADTGYVYLGQNNAVEYLYAATGQRLRITHSQFTCPDSANGGSYVWRVVGSYVKYYSPWVWRGKRDISSISSVTIIQAS